MEVRTFGVKVVLIESGWFRTSVLDKATVRPDPSSPYAALGAAVQRCSGAAVQRCSGEAVPSSRRSHLHDP